MKNITDYDELLLGFTGYRLTSDVPYERKGATDIICNPLISMVSRVGIEPTTT